VVNKRMYKRAVSVNFTLLMFVNSVINCPSQSLTSILLLTMFNLHIATGGSHFTSRLHMKMHCIESHLQLFLTSWFIFNQTTRCGSIDTMDGGGPIGTHQRSFEWYHPRAPTVSSYQDWGSQPGQPPPKTAI